jgi:16S rRNA G966 N2-methylase RsmD
MGKNTTSSSIGVIRSECPVCGESLDCPLGGHIRSQHGEKEFKQAVLEAKAKGMLDKEIGMLFGVTFRQLEKIITEAYGINISALKKPKIIKYWGPRNFKEETTTVWSFKQRGDWATHNGMYRGNWTPYIPRNVILKYSNPGDIVLDYFVGSGTTAVEAKLLGRRCIARDINPACIALTRENLNFNIPATLFEKYPSLFEPEVSIGDARDLSDIQDNSVDLICAHPPYAGIISYSTKIDGDLSQLPVGEFLKEMIKVARESYRVLKPCGKCAILIGDTRKRKHVVPIGFRIINIFLNEGFKLKELVIKRQHNCKATGFWYEKSIKYNFLLLAHEYLPIFEKPKANQPSVVSVEEKEASYTIATPVLENLVLKKDLDKFETTTVWIFPKENFEEQLNKNVIDRYSQNRNYTVITFTHCSKNKANFATTRDGQNRCNTELLFVKALFWDNTFSSSKEIGDCLNKITETVRQELSNIQRGGFLVIQTKDIRINEHIEPIAIKLVDALAYDALWLKEIVVVVQEGKNQNHSNNPTECLKIVHQYLLVYEVKK